MYKSGNNKYLSNRKIEKNWEKVYLHEHKLFMIILWIWSKIFISSFGCFQILGMKEISKINQKVFLKLWRRLRCCLGGGVWVGWKYHIVFTMNVIGTRMWFFLMFVCCRECFMGSWVLCYCYLGFTSLVWKFLLPCVFWCLYLLFLALYYLCACIFLLVSRYYLKLCKVNYNLCRLKDTITTRNSRFSCGIICGFWWIFCRKQISCGFCLGLRFPGNTFAGNCFLGIL